MRPNIPSLFSCVLLLVSPSAQALIDTDSNGMSDLWQAKHNFVIGANPPADQLPGADPDSDGWTNLQEATAGTNPWLGLPTGGPLTPSVSYTKAILEPPPPGSEVGQTPASPTGDPNDPFSNSGGATAEGPVLEIRRAARFNLSWQTVAGKAYRVLHSQDLVTWLPASDWFLGEGTPFSYQGEAINADNTEPSKLFYRIVVEDSDSDGDGHTDWEEGENDTDPYSIDTDKDGIPDNLDTNPGSLTNPNLLATSATYADPDWRGLINANLLTGLRANWDFEEASFPFGTLFGKTNAIARNRVNPMPAPWPLLVPLATPPDRPGFVSKGIPITNLPVYGDAKVFQGITGAFTLSFWHKFEKDSVKNSSGIYQCLWSLCESRPNSSPGTINSNTLAIRKKNASEEEIYLGAYTWTSGGGNPHSVLGGTSFTRPAGTADDGNWHHYTIVRSGGKYTLVIDGQTVPSINNTTVSWLPVGLALPTPTTPNDWHYDWNVFGRMAPNLSQNQTSGTFDRIRIWDHALTSTETTKLYRENTDRDALWDITEVKTALWRDNNSNAQRDPGETTFSSHPLEWQDDGHDTDGDGLTDEYEQNVSHTDIANPDTDGDLIPDGWEVEYDLDPNDPSDAALNPDNDGQNNFNEYLNATDPNVSNSATDPIPLAERLTINLGIGDKSGSKSEDYVMHIFRIDPETGEEKRIRTLRSGGFGQYEEQPLSIFRKGETYTFQIDWQKSNNAKRAANPSAGVTAEGPDFDYTFKVEPQGETSGFLIDGYSPGKRSADLSKPLLAADASDVAQTQAEFKEKYESRRVVLLGIATKSADRMFGGAMQILPGLEDIQLEITNEVTNEDFGTHSQLFANAYSGYSEILGAGDKFGADVSDPRVWFIKDEKSFIRRIQFYLCGDPAKAHGKMKIAATFRGVAIGQIKRTLSVNPAFANLLDITRAVASGSNGGLPGTPVPLPGAAHHWSAAPNIPIFLLQFTDENLTLLATGIYNGFIAGLADDAEFVQLIATQVVIPGLWLKARAEAYLHSYATDPALRFRQLKDLIYGFVENQLVPAASAVSAGFSSPDEWIATIWAAEQRARIAMQYMALLAAKGLWNVCADGLADWWVDFSQRMLDETEAFAINQNPFPKNAMVSGAIAFQQTAAYTVGYCTGYLVEQVAVGYLTEGGIPIAKILLVGGERITLQLAKRTAATVATKYHWMRGVIGESTYLAEATERALYRMGIVMYAVDPTTPVLRDTAAELIETLARRTDFDDAIFNNTIVGNAIREGNLRKLTISLGKQNLVRRRTAQLAHLLGAEADAVTMKNFLTVAEERLVLDRGQGVVDEWLEDFFRAFKGNPAEYVNRPSLDDLSSNGILRIKNFLNDPNPGYAWKFEEGVETNWKAPIVRGLLVELDLWHRVYKPAGWTHLPTAEAVDMVKGVQALQIKSIGTVNANRIARLKEAITDLADYGRTNNKMELSLDIRKKPGLDTGSLEQQLHDHIDTLRDEQILPEGIELNITILGYDFLPTP